MAYEGSFKVLQSEPMYYTIYKNRTNDGISTDHLKAAYLEGNHIHVDSPSVQSKDTSLKMTILHPIINNHDDILEVSDNQLEIRRFGRRAGFPEHLTNYCSSDTITFCFASIFLHYYVQ